MDNTDTTDKLATSFHTRLAIIEREQQQLTQFLSRLESTMDKLSTVLSSLKETIIMHDLKLATQEKSEIVDVENVKEIGKRVTNLEQFKWYATGILAVLMFIMPFVYKFILKL